MPALCHDARLEAALDPGASAIAPGTKLARPSLCAAMRPITPRDNNGSILLRFSVAGQRYSFCPVPGGSYTDELDLAKAQAVASQIRLDILAGHFDPTLACYRPSSAPKPSPPKTLLEIWDAWVRTLGLSAATQADHYARVRRMLVKASPKPGQTTWLTAPGISASTFNKRLRMARRCMSWALGQGYVAINPYGDIKPRKMHKRPIQPFTQAEAQAIIASFARLYPHYAAFVAFLFLTGCRLSEAIGLQWKHVDLAQGTLDVSESLPHDRTGNGYKRVRKSTKTGSTRLLALSPELRSLLASAQPEQPQAEALVFQSPRGCAIASCNFWVMWQKALQAADVPYRKIHTIRHTLLSMAIEQGLPVTAVAYIAGHKDSRMVLETYGHIINRPELPDVGLGEIGAGEDEQAEQG
ncbi:MAG: site-specific integrase [Cyanobacteria bacterium P01_A01_bin.114]